MQQDLTVLVRSCTGDEDVLRRCIDAILHQNYESFEVVVVLSPAEEDNINLLERIEQYGIGLRHIVLPKSVRSISTEQLMLTLGIRSARREWVVVTQSDCRPISNQWLQTIAQHIGSDADVVLGFTEKRNGNFAHLWRQMTDFRNSKPFHPYHTDISNIALRKSVFMSSGGTSAFAMLKEGALQLWASTIKARCMLDSPCAVVLQDKGQHFNDDMDGVVWMETRRHLKHTWRYRAAMFCNIAKHQIMFWAFVAATIYLVLADLTMEVARRAGINDTWLCAFSLASYLTPLCLYILFVTTTTILYNKKMLRTYGHKYGASVCLHKLLFPYSWIINRVDYAFINRRAFYK